jgi:hypothetical protein
VDEAWHDDQAPPMDGKGQYRAGASDVVLEIVDVFMDFYRFRPVVDIELCGAGPVVRTLRPGCLYRVKGLSAPDVPRRGFDRVVGVM